MATFHFDLVSPEKLAFSGEVDQVDVPGVEGDFGVLAGHAPVVAAIRPGILTVTSAARIRRSSCSAVLPKCPTRASPCSPMSRPRCRIWTGPRSPTRFPSMEAKLAEKEGSELDRAIERLDHFKSIQHQLNSTAMH